jgi:multiple sugar transport system permease protein
MFFKMGYASAMAWILFVLIMGCTALLFRSARGRVYYAGA